MLVPCPSCTKPLHVPDSALGKKAKCPACAAIFDVVARAAVGVTPLVPPRRDDSEGHTRPRGRRPRHDDDYDEAPRRDRDDDDRPSRRRGAGSAQRMADSVATWLKLAAFLLIGYFVIGLIHSYLYAAGLMNVAFGFGNMRINMGGLGPSPAGAMMIGFAVGLVIYVPCLVFMFIGAGKVVQMSGRGFVLAALIIAIVLGGLLALGAVVELINMASLFVTFFQPIHVVAEIGTSAVLLIAGIKGLSTIGRPAMRDAFRMNERSSRRRRERDDDDDLDDHRRR
jgi:hypothetical protein